MNICKELGKLNFIESIDDLNKITIERIHKTAPKFDNDLVNEITDLNFKLLIYSRQLLPN